MSATKQTTSNLSISKQLGLSIAGDEGEVNMDTSPDFPCLIQKRKCSIEDCRKRIMGKGYQVLDGETITEYTVCRDCYFILNGGTD